MAQDTVSERNNTLCLFCFIYAIFSFSVFFYAFLFSLVIFSLLIIKFTKICLVIDIGTLNESAKEICSKQPAPNFTAPMAPALACCPCCVCPPFGGYTICGAFWYNLCCGNWCCQLIIGVQSVPCKSQSVLSTEVGVSSMWAKICVLSLFIW